MATRRSQAVPDATDGGPCQTEHNYCAVQVRRMAMALSFLIIQVRPARVWRQFKPVPAAYFSLESSRRLAAVQTAANVYTSLKTLCTSALDLKSI